MVDEGKSTRSVLQEGLAQLSTELGHNLRQEKERVEQKLAESEAAKQRLEQDLQAAHNSLEEPNVSAKNNMETLEANLHEEQNTVAELKGKIQVLEEDCVKSEKVRQKWLKDIQDVDTLRTQLLQLKNRMPQVDSLAEKLAGVTRINKIIRSAAERFASEQAWIQEQLMLRNAPPADGNFLASDVNTETYTDPSVEASGRSSIHSSQHEESTQTHSYPSVQSGESRRKVTIFSPGEAIKGPVAPPSVAQEQARRRIGAKPQSILKTSTLQAESSQEVVEGPLLHPANQSQHNRPVVGCRSSTTTSAEGMVRRIRSGFVRLARTKSDLSFPTLADFERECHNNGAETNKRVAEALSDDEAISGVPRAKRRKVEV
jgi:flagellar biosynthesis chaperone FliJ